MSDLTYPRLAYDADGCAVVSPRDPADIALARLLDKAGADDGRDTVNARSLTLADCRRRFRRRVVLPVTGIVVSIPLAILIFGGGGAIARGTLSAELGEILATAGFFLLGLAALMGLLTPIWLREYRKYVGDRLDRDVRVAVTPDGVTITADGTPVLDGNWPDLMLKALGVYRYNHPRSRHDWFLDEITLLDRADREVALRTNVFTNDRALARRLIQRLNANGRLRRADG